MVHPEMHTEANERNRKALTFMPYALTGTPRGSVLSGLFICSLFISFFLDRAVLSSRGSVVCLFKRNKKKKKFTH